MALAQVAYRLCVLGPDFPERLLGGVGGSGVLHLAGEEVGFLPPGELSM